MSPALRPALLAFALLAQSLAAIADTLSREQVRADFDALYAGLREAHADLFAATPKAVFDRRHAALRASFDEPMTTLAMQRELQTFVALARHSHARIDFPFASYGAWVEAGGKPFPLELRIRDGRVLVAGDYREARRGDEILAVDGLPVAAWLARLTRHLSADTPRLAQALAEVYLPGLVWLEFGESPSYDLRLVPSDGGRTEVTVPAGSAAREVAPGEQPFSLAGREARMLDPEIAYLRPGPFSNTESGGYVWDTASYTAFLDDAFAKFLEAGARHLVIDLRDNPGGDSSFSDPLVAWFADRPFRFASAFRVRVSPQTTAANQARLDARNAGAGGVSARYAKVFADATPGSVIDFPLEEITPRTGQRFDGAVHVLVNRYSYSNAVTVAALIQDYGFGQILGETTGDMATTYAALEQFALPHSGIRVSYPKAYMIRPNGDAEVAPVTPDVRLRFPLLRGEHDEVLAEAVHRIRET